MWNQRAINILPPQLFIDKYLCENIEELIGESDDSQKQTPQILDLIKILFLSSRSWKATETEPAPTKTMLTSMPITEI